MKAVQQILGFIDYFADTDGNIYSTRRGKLRKLKTITQGGSRSVVVSLEKEGHYKRKVYQVSRLIAKTFLPNPHNYPVVMHKDNVKVNNSVANLKWGTHSQNTQQSFDDGRAPKGEKHCFSKLTDMQRINMRKEWLSSGLTQKELSLKYGVSWRTIAKYCKK